MDNSQINSIGLRPAAGPLFVELVCGSVVPNSSYFDADYIGVFRRLRKDVEMLHGQVTGIIANQCPLPASAVFPFFCRKLLEVSLTSLLARIDPMRVIAVRKHQQHESYEEGRQNVSSISWTGDILPSDKYPSNDIWDIVNLKKGTERSLLGWHIGEVAIAPGLRWILDNPVSSSAWVTELGRVDNPLIWLKVKVGKLYSLLSKGVHAEYLLDDEIAFDDASIKQHVSDCYMLICLLSVATHATPLFNQLLCPKAALANLIEIEKVFQ